VAAYVGTVDSYVGAADSNVGATDSYVGTMHSYIGAVDSFVSTAHSYVGAVHSNVDAADSYVDAVDSYVDAADSFVGAVHSNVDAVHGYVGAVDSFIGAVHSNADAVHAYVDAVDSFVGAVHSNVDAVHAYVGAVDSYVGAMHSNVSAAQKDVVVSSMRLGPVACCLRDPLAWENCFKPSRSQHSSPFRASRLMSRSASASALANRRLHPERIGFRLNRVPTMNGSRATGIQSAVATAGTTDTGHGLRMPAPTGWLRITTADTTMPDDGKVGAASCRTTTAGIGADSATNAGSRAANGDAKAASGASCSYSLARARTGSTRVARSAGRKLAPSAVAASVAMTPANTAASRGFT